MSPAQMGIYVHWPFCRAKCPYCDFNSHVRHEPVDAQVFARSLACELASFAPLVPHGTVASVFFGGGTPSLMPPAAVNDVLAAIGALWTLDEHAEITLEANPTSAESSNFRGYRAAGVNRLSVGVQALNDDDLKALGRQHTAREALAAFNLAADIFPRVSFDMIYARPGQGVDHWRRELREALLIQRGHMSLYQLTIEPGTRYFDLHARGMLAIPGEETAAALYDVTQELTALFGLRAYEVSNHAAPGHESRHNLIYWRYGDYIGVGPGAHSRLTSPRGRLAIATERHPETWRALVARQGHGRVEETYLSPVDQGLEMLLMGLRLEEGIVEEDYARLSGRRLDSRTLSLLTEDGLLVRDLGSGRMAATAKGRRLLNAVTSALAG
ncbi:MAG TPA: radical SAM family heme chaperone HemW [Aestuariivirgaceae bacterium]